jgi:hypothetical protein
MFCGLEDVPFSNSADLTAPQDRHKARATPPSKLSPHNVVSDAVADLGAGVAVVNLLGEGLRRWCRNLWRSWSGRWGAGVGRVLTGAVFFAGGVPARPFGETFFAERFFAATFLTDEAFFVGFVTFLRDFLGDSLFGADFTGVRAFDFFFLEPAMLDLPSWQSRRSAGPSG